jgi:hypothetical protein
MTIPVRTDRIMRPIKPRLLLEVMYSRSRYAITKLQMRNSAMTTYSCVSTVPKLSTRDPISGEPEKASVVIENPANSATPNPLERKYVASAVIIMIVRAVKEIIGLL